MYIYIYIYTYICIYTINKYIYIYIYVYIYIYMYIYMYIYIYVYIYVYIYICISISIYICVCIYIYICIYICIYIHIYMYIYIYLFTYIYSYIYVYIHIYIYTNTVWYFIGFDPYQYGLEHCRTTNHSIPMSAISSRSGNSRPPTRGPWLWLLWFSGYPVAEETKRTKLILCSPSPCFFDLGLSENRVSQWNSHLIGIMIINHWV